MVTPQRLSAPPLVVDITRAIVQRIASGEWSDGTHLVTQNIASLLMVSRFPVQSAMVLAEELGVVRREPHRGYFVSGKPRQLAKALNLLAEKPKPDDAYLQIATDRLAGRLAESVKEADLSKAYNLNRANLNAVLHRMAQEGWIERKPGYGWRFLPILTSTEAYRYSYRFRVLIEPAALLEPTFKMNAVVIEKLRAQQLDLLNGRLATTTSVDLFEITVAFHEAVTEASGNPFFIESLKRVNRLRRLMEYKAMRPVQRFDEQSREHLTLLDMIEAGQFAVAADFLKRHIQIGHAKKRDILDATETNVIAEASVPASR